MSNFLYIHRDLSGVPDVWKVGVAMTPYSAVRARQKFCWNQFGLQHLYFGTAACIAHLEWAIKNHFNSKSGKAMKNYGTQTEMFNVPIDDLLIYIEWYIDRNRLLVQKIEMSGDYTASRSGACPFGIPSETLAGEWCQEKINDIFANRSDPVENFVLGRGRKKTNWYRNTFDHFFEL
jgi:hypothetical protein